MTKHANRIYGPFTLVALSLLLTPALHAGDIQTDGAFVSTAVSGEPLKVSSTDLVIDLNADMVDGVHGSALAAKLGNVFTVAVTGGDATTVSSVNASITDASATNPYLVVIGPGIFSQPGFTAKSHVHYRGSGEEVTVLEGTGAGPIMTAEANSTISDLSIHNTTSSGVTFAAAGTLDVAVKRVTIRSQNGDSTNFNPVEITAGARVDFEDVTVLGAAGGNAHVFGVFVDDSTANLRDLTVEIIINDGRADGIHANNASTVTVDGGVIDLFAVANAANFGITAEGSASGGIPRVSAKRLDIEAEGFSSDNRGAFIRGGIFEIVQSSILVEKGTQGRGIRGAARDDVTSITVRDCSIDVRNGDTDIGIEGFGSSTSETITVYNSQIKASDNVASAGTSWTINLIRSHMDGGATSGTVVCRYVTDESFSASETICPT